MKAAAKEPKARKTLVQLNGEVKLKDPAAFARHQVAELDKTAKKSILKRKKISAEIEADQKEIDYLEAKIAEIKRSYDPLCEDLNHKLTMKSHLKNAILGGKGRKPTSKDVDPHACLCEQCKALQPSCVEQEKMIMADTKHIVDERKLGESHLMRKMATTELEMVRGYAMGADSTYRQGQSPLRGGTQSLTGTGSSFLPKIGNATAKSAVNE